MGRVLKPRQGRRADRRREPARGATAVLPSDRAPVLLLEQTLYAVLFLSVALVCDFSLESQYTLPKLAYLYVLMPLIAALWLVRLRRGNVKPVPIAVFGTALALAVWCGMSTVFAWDRPTAVFGLYSRFNGLGLHLVCLTLFLFCASSRMPPEAVERRVGLLTAALVPVAAYGAYQYLYPDPSFLEGRRPPSTVGHPVIVAAILSLAVPFVVTWCMLAAGWVRRAAWGAVLVVMLAAIVTSLSRGPWAGLAVALAIVLLGRLHESGVRVGKATVLGVGAIAFGLAVLAVAVATVVRPGSFGSFTSRFMWMGAALAMIRDHPMTGVGLENYALAYPRYRPVGNPLNIIPTQVHNGYLQLAATAGVPALVFYAALVLAVLLTLYAARRRLASRRARLLTAAFAAAIVSYLVQDLSGWLEVSLSVFFWILLGLAVSWSTQGSQSETPLPRWGRVLGYVWGVGAICGSLVLFTHTIREVRANGWLTRAEGGDPAQNWPMMAQDIAAALAQVPDDAAYLDRAGGLYAKRLNASGDRDAYALGVSAFERAHRLNPFYPYVLIHRIQLETVALRLQVITTAAPQAEAAVVTLLQTDLRNPSAYEAVARLRVLQGRVEEALPLVEAAIASGGEQPLYQAMRTDLRRRLGLEPDGGGESGLADPASGH